MYSVDLAAESFLRNLGVTADYYLAQSRRGWTTRRGRLSHKHLKSPETLAGYDLVLYWGDFLNNLAYGLGDFTTRQIRWSQQEPDAAFAH